MDFDHLSNLFDTTSLLQYQNLINFFICAYDMCASMCMCVRAQALMHVSMGVYISQWCVQVRGQPQIFLFIFFETVSLLFAAVYTSLAVP